ncbi:hypothetical protein BKA82DRAFT_4018202 [Pisolithus tinctorius]|nr:hypothetical protein BKA82DRAFT_4018202 [Pisolithus tinctorius]
MPHAPKSVDQVMDNSTDLHTWVLRNCKIPTTKMAPPPEIKKDKPRPRHAVQPPEGWEEHMFGLRDRRRSLMPSVSVSSQNSTAPILQEDQVEGTPMDKDAGEAEAEAEEVEVNILADEGSQHPDDGASQLLDDEVDDDGSESSLPPSLPPAEDSSSDAEDEFPPRHPGCHVEHKPKSKGKSRAMDVDNSDILNEANLFCSWYWATQPKPDGINNIITAEYNQLMKDIPKDDTAARKEKLKAVYEWSESSSAVPTNKSVKSIAVRVHNAKTQFSGLAEAWSTLEDIKIAGVVMYVGQDPAGHQTSGIFGGSDIIQKYINECAIDVWGLMDKYTTIFKCLRDGNGTEAGLLGTSASASSAAALELCCRMKEIPRDCNCWPLGVPPLGPGFEYKKLKADALRQLVVPYLQRKLGSMYDRQSDDNNDKKMIVWMGEIALLKAPDGTVLRKVSDDPEWQKSHEEEDPGMAAPHAQSGIPFPSHKQAHVEVMDNDTVPHEHAQAVRTLESLVDLSAPCRLSAMGICIVMLPQAIHTHGTLALLSSFHHLGVMRTVKVGQHPWLLFRAELERVGLRKYSGQKSEVNPTTGWRDIRRTKVSEAEVGVGVGEAEWTSEGVETKLQRGLRGSRRSRAVQYGMAASPTAHVTNLRAELSGVGQNMDRGPQRGVEMCREGQRSAGTRRRRAEKRGNMSEEGGEVLPPARHGSGHFPPSRQTYRIPSRPDHHVYHDAPYISDYYPPAQPTAQQWVDRGSAAPYEDKFPEDYLDY